MVARGVTVSVEGHALTLTNLDKVLFPASGMTKREVCRYYTEIGEVILPHLRDRPVTLRRAPDGVDGMAFFQKHVPRGAPDWVHTVDVNPSGRGRHGANDASRADGTGGGAVPFTAIDSLASLVWAANLAAIELHVPMWRVDRARQPQAPDLLVFDLDPGPAASVLECCAVARWVRERLVHDGLAPLAKTSGSKGLQLYARVADVAPAIDTLTYARQLAEALERDHRDLVVSNMRRDIRQGKVLIDWSQNHPAKTTVAPYSLRIRPEPMISTPISWDELEDAASTGDAARFSFGPDDVLARVRSVGDLFAPLADASPAGGDQPDAPRSSSSRRSRSSRSRS